VKAVYELDKPIAPLADVSAKPSSGLEPETPPYHDDLEPLSRLFAASRKAGPGDTRRP
jgi:hypothetical protein